jgi:hypothetical protein
MVVKKKKKVWKKNDIIMSGAIFLYVAIGSLALAAVFLILGVSISGNLVTKRMDKDPGAIESNASRSRVRFLFASAIIAIVLMVPPTIALIGSSGVAEKASSACRRELLKAKKQFEKLRASYSADIGKVASSIVSLV